MGNCSLIGNICHLISVLSCGLSLNVLNNESMYLS